MMSATLLPNQEAEQEMMIENIKALDRSSESLTNIGGYSVVEYLGQGAFGVVYKVRHSWIVIVTHTVTYYQVKRPDSDYYYAMKEVFCGCVASMIT